jgi:hypothetical protein
VRDAGPGERREDREAGDREFQVVQGPSDHRSVQELHGYHRAEWGGEVQPDGCHQFRAGGAVDAAAGCAAEGSVVRV